MTPSQRTASALIHPTTMALESIATSVLKSHYFIDLSSLSLIQVGGTDAQTFLQRQFSNDINALEAHHCQLHAYCNPKGRTLAIIRIVRNQPDNGFWMIVPRDMSDALISRLKMFVMRAKVTIQPDTEYSLFGLLGEPKQVELADSSYWVDCKLPQPIPRRLIITRSSTISDNTPLYHADLWRWLDIQSGIPQVYTKTIGAFIPQTINLELVNGVSFKKGCFPGQEIIARIKYLGKPKQRLIIAELESDNPILPGDEIYSPIKPEQKSGLVVDAVKTEARHAGNRWQLSAMIPATMIESGDLMLGSINGAKLTRIALPYPIICRTNTASAKKDR